MRKLLILGCAVVILACAAALYVSYVHPCQVYLADGSVTAEWGVMPDFSIDGNRVRVALWPGEVYVLHAYQCPSQKGNVLPTYALDWRVIAFERSRSYAYDSGKDSDTICTDGTLSLWLVVALLVGAQLALVRRPLRRWRRLRKGLCPDCGYIAANLPSERCPECGGAKDGLSAPAQAKPLWPNLRRILLVGSVSLAALVILACAAVWLFGIAAERDWSACLADLRMRGEPVTIDELEAWLPTATVGSSGAAVIQGLADVLRPSAFAQTDGVYVADRDYDCPIITRGLSPRRIEASREWLEAYRPAVDELYTLLDMPAGRPSRDRLCRLYDDGSDCDYSLQEWRGAMVLLRLDGVLRFLDDDVDGAARAFCAQLSVLDTLEWDPDPRATGAVGWWQVRAVSYLEDLLRGGELNAQAIGLVDAALQKRLRSQRMTLSLLTYRALHIDLFEALARGEVDASSMAELAKTPMGMRDTNFLPRLALRSYQLQGARMWTDLLDCGDDLDKLMLTAERIDDSDDFPALITRFWPTALQFEAYAKGVAAARCARVALAAERIRMKTGRLPRVDDVLAADLDEQTWTDPFGGARLRVVAGDGSLTIYSIGPDRTDNGGMVTVNPKRPFGTKDIGFTMVEADRRVVRIQLPH